MVNNTNLCACGIAHCGRARLQSPTLPSFWKLFLTVTCRELAFPVLRGRGYAQPSTHVTQNALESGLTQTEESGNVYPASREKTQSTAAKPENTDLCWKKPLTQFCYLSLAMSFYFSGSRLFSSRYIRVSKPSIEVAPEISVSPLPPGLKRNKTWEWLAVRLCGFSRVDPTASGFLCLALEIERAQRHASPLYPFPFLGNRLPCGLIR